jgi:hypothetical protein
MQLLELLFLGAERGETCGLELGALKRRAGFPLKPHELGTLPEYPVFQAEWHCVPAISGARVPGLVSKGTQGLCQESGSMSFLALSAFQVDRVMRIGTILRDST